MAVDPSRATREAFDRIAATIDELPQRNRTTLWMRERSRQEIVRTVPPRSSLVEIGCGTGADAVYLGARGHRVVALDISQKMVEQARARVRDEGLDRSITLLCGRLSELIGQVESSAEFPFGGVYANFSLTYEASLREVGGLVDRLLGPGGWFLFTLPNRLPLADALVSIGRFHPPWRSPRLRHEQRRLLSGVSVRMRSYLPTEVRRELGERFRCGGMVGLSVFSPSPGFYRPGMEPFLRPLRFLDDRFCARFPWKLLGDHTLFKFQKAGRAAGAIHSRPPLSPVRS